MMPFGGFEMESRWAASLLKTAAHLPDSGLNRKASLLSPISGQSRPGGMFQA